jgi:hypothetical protein
MYTKNTLGPSFMMNIVFKIVVELLSVLALAMKQIKQGQFSECAVTDTIPVA